MPTCHTSSCANLDHILACRHLRAPLPLLLSQPLVLLPNAAAPSAFLMLEMSNQLLLPYAVAVLIMPWRRAYSKMPPASITGPAWGEQWQGGAFTCQQHCAHGTPNTLLFADRGGRGACAGRIYSACSLRVERKEPVCMHAAWWPRPVRL